jgi:hypothetical protein
MSEERDSAAAGAENPLVNLGILQNVLSYVGPGHCLFVKPVSKRWKDMYAMLEHQQLTLYDEDDRELAFTIDPEMTSFSAALNSAFASPSIVVLAHLSNLDCRSQTYQRAAGKYADVATLTTARALGMPYTATTMAAAARSNKLAEVQYLHSQGCPWPVSDPCIPGLLENAAREGHFEMVRWCYEHGCSWRLAYWAPHCAADSGCIELMAWVLQQPGTRLSEDVMRYAAFKGHKAMCQYLRAQQCPWDESSITTAAHGGHVDLLRWLVDNGCPYDRQYLCRIAATGGSVEVLLYLQQQGLLTTSAELTDTLDIAIYYWQFAAGTWLREQGANGPRRAG